MRVAARSSAVQQKLLNRHKGRDVAPPNLKLGGRWKWMVNVTLRPIYFQEKGTHWSGGWVDPRTGLGVFEDEQISSDRKSTPSEQHNLE